MTYFFKRRISLFFYLGLTTWLSLASLAAVEPSHIADNSFLIEEAYNQEPGVIQHISAFQFNKDKSWNFSFTDEWPLLSQLHQLSISLPVAHAVDPESLTGIADILFNYRYQAISNSFLAFSPRISVIFPTGSYQDGFGSGTLAGQVNLPLSIELHDLAVIHGNLGFTYFSGRKDFAGNSAETNYGLSLIYRPFKTFHLLVELSGKRTDIQPDGLADFHSYELFLNPGFRHAINFDSGLQICWGLALPIGLGENKSEYGVFLYLSFEHEI